MESAKNDFERRVRESEEALLRHVPPGKRPFGETWWWFLLTTAYAWTQVGVLLWQVAQGLPIDRYRLWAVALVVVGLPAFAWARRQGQRKRLEAHARHSAAPGPPVD